MNNLCRKIAIVLGGCLLSTQAAMAFDIPSYITKPEDISGNICIIIEQNTPTRLNAQTAQEMSKKTNETITEYAAKLYAEALSTRAAMVEGGGGSLGGLGGEAGKAIGGAAEKLGGMLGSSSKQAVLQNDVKSQVKNIALKVKQIVELEAAIANLQGAQLLSAMDEVSCTDVVEETEE